MSSNASLSTRVAEALLRTEAVALQPEQPFTWTSGIISPIYCDNRITISYPDVREMIADGFAQLVRELHPDAEVIAGIATGGIPHGSWVAQKLNLPMIYIRDKPKGHGKQNQIEGVLKPGQKVVAIEDLISTGGSSLRAAMAVGEAGGDMLGVLAIFTYEFAQAAEAFAEKRIPLRTLTTYSELIGVAEKLGRIEPQHVALLQQWRQNPTAFGK